MPERPDSDPDGLRLVYATLAHVRKGDFHALNELVTGLDLGQRDTLLWSLAFIAAAHVPLTEQQLSAACLQAAAGG